MLSTDIEIPQSPEVWTILDNRLDRKACNIYSQFGEDGLIAAALQIIGTTNRCCWECGASDGITFSNVRRLIDAGWSAVLIDKDPLTLGELQKLQSDRVHVISATVSGDNIDEILRLGGCPESPDLGVLDIDGQEYHVWRAMRTRPRLMLVEFKPRDHGYAIPDIDSRKPVEQATAAAIIELGREKGYGLLALTYVNALFVEQGAWR